MEQAQLFGNLTHKDLRELGGGRRRVRNLMLDGNWHSALEIRKAAQGSEGLRRLRELRGLFEIEKRRIDGSRHFEYRLTHIKNIEEHI